METKINWMICLLAGLLFGACSGNRPVQIQGVLEADPDIFPDYKGVTVPMNIAPLNFSYLGNEPCRLVVEVAGHELMQMEGRRGLFSFPVSDWKDWMGRYAGDSLRLTVLAYQSDQWKRYRSFSIYIAPDSIDSYLSYRLVPPGYEGWREMGIYQRDLSDYEQRPILENRLTKGNCVNCHAYCERDPSRMMFHARADLAGTLILQDGLVEKLDVQTEQMGSFVYPYWHPSGDYIAFSMNKTRQNFYSHDPDRVEVYDTASDVVIYSVKDHKIMTSPLLRSTCAFETFPTFSPDGHFLWKDKVFLFRVCLLTDVSWLLHFMILVIFLFGIRKLTCICLICLLPENILWMFSIRKRRRAIILGAVMVVGWCSAAGGLMDFIHVFLLAMLIRKGWGINRFCCPRRIL